MTNLVCLSEGFLVNYLGKDRLVLKKKKRAKIKPEVGDYNWVIYCVITLTSTEAVRLHPPLSEIIALFSLCFLN